MLALKKKKKVLSRISLFFPIQELQHAFQISKPSAYFYYQYYSKEREDKAELFLSVQKVIKLYRYFLKSSVIVMLTDENVFMHHFSKKNYGNSRSPNSYPSDFSWTHDVMTALTRQAQLRRSLYRWEMCIRTGPTLGSMASKQLCLGRGMQQPSDLAPFIPTAPKLLRFQERMW